MAIIIGMKEIEEYLIQHGAIKSDLKKREKKKCYIS